MRLGGASDGPPNTVDIISPGRNDVSLGTGADTLLLILRESGGNETLVRDLAAEDQLSIVDDTGSVALFGDELFAAMDGNDDQVIDRDDRGSVTVGDVELRVEVDAGGMTLTLSDNVLDLAGTFATTIDQWT